MELLPLLWVSLTELLPVLVGGCLLDCLGVGLYRRFLGIRFVGFTGFRILLRLVGFGKLLDYLIELGFTFFFGVLILL